MITCSYFCKFNKCARWLPQLFYFLFAYKTLKQKERDIVFSIPSGNFGNICAGMVAQKLGMPVKHFIASNNENNVEHVI